MARKGKNSTELHSALQALGFASGIGIHFVVLLVICLFLGKKADVYFQIAPWGTVLGLLLGFLTGMWSTYKKIVGK